jgi:VCBS repeat-containing protein
MQTLIQRPLRTLAVLILTAAASLLATPAHANEKVYAQAIHGTVLITVPSGFGTGVLVDAEKRLVVTAAHVATEDQDIRVVFADFDARGHVIAERAHYLPDDKPHGIAAKVVARQKDSDLLVLQLESLPAGVKPIKLAADSAVPGQAVHVIGNASLARNAAFGTRSGKVDSVYRNEPTEDFPYKAQLMASSTPTNKGDSGGPLLNDSGELIGIVSSGTVSWATAHLAGPELENAISQHPLAGQQSVCLGIDVTEVQAILKQANGDVKNDKPVEHLKPSPWTTPAATTTKEPSLVGGKWTMTATDGFADLTFRADGTFSITLSNAEGVIQGSTRGNYTYSDGTLTMTSAEGKKATMSVKWNGNDNLTTTAGAEQVTWKRN